MPSAIASLSATTASVGAPPATSVRTASFAPAGFLISSIRSAALAERDPLEAAERGVEALESRDDLVRAARRARAPATRPRARCRRCRARAAAAARGALPPASRARRRSRRARPARSRAPRRRAAAACSRTAGSVVAEVADVGGVRRRTARRSATQYFESAACWSPPGCAWRGSSTPNDERGTAAREVAELRVVPVDDQLRVGRERLDQAAPPLRRSARARRSGRAGRERGWRGRGRGAARSSRDLGQRGLVDLEEAELRAVGGEQGGGDARDEVRAGRGCARAAPCRAGSPPPSRPWSSCRSSPRARRATLRQAPRERGRWRRGPASRAACPAASSRRRRRPAARARPRPRAVASERGQRKRNAHGATLLRKPRDPLARIRDAKTPEGGRFATAPQRAHEIHSNEGPRLPHPTGRSLIRRGLRCGAERRLPRPVDCGNSGHGRATKRNRDFTCGTDERF